MKNIHERELKRFIEALLKKMKGRWVLCGGNALSLMDDEHRATVDIDIAPLDEVGNATLVKLMAIAEEVGLPVEAVNMAVGYFLEKIPNFQKHLTLFSKGKGVELYIPDATLFMVLKIPRLSETDFEDCVRMLEVTAKKGLKVEKNMLFQAIEKSLKDSKGNAGKIRRLKSLKKSVGISD